MTAEVVKRAQADVGIRPPPPSQVHAKVTAVQTESYGRVIVTLDSGQVWEQTDTNLTFPVNVGDEIHIKNGVLGVLWMLDAHDRVQTRVKRIK